MTSTIVKRSVRTMLAGFARRDDSIAIQLGRLRRYRLPKQIGLENLSMVFGRYEPGFMSDLFQQCCRVKTAYDVGANFGYTSLVMAEALGPLGSVYAFEPSPRVHESLVATIRLNALQQVVVPRREAVSDAVGNASFVMPDCNTQGLLNEAEQGQVTAEYDRFEVPTTTLDHFVFEQQNEVPDLLKIDVEGGECLVLRGARRVLSESRPRVLLELHGRQRASQLWDTMLPHRYAWRSLYGRSRAIGSKAQLLEQFESKWTVRHFCLAPT